MLNLNYGKIYEDERNYDYDYSNNINIKDIIRTINHITLYEQEDYTYTNSSYALN